MPSATAIDEINHQSTATSFTRRVTTSWPQATAFNGNPNRQGGIAVHGQSSIRALCVIPTLNKPLCPRQLRLMKSSFNPLLPRLHFGLPLRGQRPHNISANYCPTVGRVTCSLHENNPLGSPRSCSVCDMVAIVRCGTPTYTWACPH